MRKDTHKFTVSLKKGLMFLNGILISYMPQSMPDIFTQHPKLRSLGIDGL